MNAGRRHSLFVYGSLLAGEVNHARMRGADFLTRDRLHGAQLLDGGSYPFLVFGPGTVWGECYRISADLLSLLDDFEDHPSVYRREQVELASGRVAWAYVGQAPHTSNLPVVVGGNWRDRC